MAKGIGLIGNFKGKVGNMVGYHLKDSNNKQTQGVRVYQPIVKNPKTSAQAEQRAKLAPINATYRALKMVIDRGNEGLPYGNKSRLAWLKQAFKAQNMPWIVKGQQVAFPVGCQLTKGSLANVSYDILEDAIQLSAPTVPTGAAVATIGGLSTILLASYPTLKEGDQITLVAVGNAQGAIESTVFSFEINHTDAKAVSGFILREGYITWEHGGKSFAGAVIVSREGANGEHLRSTASLKIVATYTEEAPYDATSKAAAIESYMNSASVNADWAEESIQ